VISNNTAPARSDTKPKSGGVLLEPVNGSVSFPIVVVECGTVVPS
jgi:hypothetical protein